MPLQIRDRIVLPPYLPPYFKAELLAAIFGAIAYGIVAVLSGNCFHLVLKKRDIYRKRMRILLSIYIIVMLLSSTWKEFGSISTLMGNLTSKRVSLSLHRSTGLPTIVTTWGADGFMTWRCLILYQHISGGPRVGIIVVLSLISLASFACGVMAVVEEMTYVNELDSAFIVFISLSALVNIFLAALIIFRLVYHRRYVRNTLGVEHGSPYTNIITICIESSALMVIATGLYTILGFLPGYGAQVMIDIIPHICVISPLLIVYRVALGRAIPPALLRSEQVMDQIRVNIPVSNPAGQEGEV